MLPCTRVDVPIIDLLSGISAKLLPNLILAVNPPKELLNEEELFLAFEEGKFRNALARVWFTIDWISLLGSELFT